MDTDRAASSKGGAKASAASVSTPGAMSGSVVPEKYPNRDPRPHCRPRDMGQSLGGGHIVPGAVAMRLEFYEASIIN